MGKTKDFNVYKVLKCERRDYW